VQIGDLLLPTFQPDGLKEPAHRIGQALVLIEGTLRLGFLVHREFHLQPFKGYDQNGCTPNDRLLGFGHQLFATEVAAVQGYEVPDTTNPDATTVNTTR
jgi:hypothetical protein